MSAVSVTKLFFYVIKQQIVLLNGNALIGTWDHKGSRQVGGNQYKNFSYASLFDLENERGSMKLIQSYVCTYCCYSKHVHV